MSIPESNLSIKNLYPDIKFGDEVFSDLWNTYKMDTTFRSKTERFELYNVSEGERWDLIAQQLYNNRELWWVIPLFNDIDDPFAINFSFSVSKHIKQLKIIKEEYLPLLISDIRKRRLKLG